MLKQTAVTISPILCTSFNLSIMTGVVPDSWEILLIIPVPKQGDLPDPNNCPILSLPIISKVFEHIIFEKLCQQLNISDQQWGFLPGRSTTHLHNCHCELAKIVSFFDLQKAFDSVPHKLLKLLSLGVQPHTLAWLSRYLFNSSQNVGVAGTTFPCHVISGLSFGLVAVHQWPQLKGGSITMLSIYYCTKPSTQLRTTSTFKKMLTSWPNGWLTTN